jgi:hypothetical protein
MASSRPAPFDSFMRLGIDARVAKDLDTLLAVLAFWHHPGCAEPRSAWQQGVNGLLRCAQMLQKMTVVGETVGEGRDEVLHSRCD